jgi:hypothetical protein
MCGVSSFEKFSAVVNVRCRKAAMAAMILCETFGKPMPYSALAASLIAILLMAALDQVCASASGRFRVTSVAENRERAETRIAPLCSNRLPTSRSLPDQPQRSADCKGIDCDDFAISALAIMPVLTALHPISDHRMICANHGRGSSDLFTVTYLRGHREHRGPADDDIARSAECRPPPNRNRMMHHLGIVDVSRRRINL